MDVVFSGVIAPEGFLGHLAYFLLVLSMMMRIIVWLRLLVIASAVVSIIYYGIMMGDIVSAFWETLLITVNTIQLAITGWRNWQARFTTAEQEFAAQFLPALPPGQTRRLLDSGRWVLLADGDVLARQGEAVSHLSYLSQGRARVEADGVQIGTVAPRAYVGEMSVTTGGPASATVIVEGQAVVWQVEAAALRRLMERQPELERALQASFFRDICAKLVTLNSAASQARRTG